MLEYAQLTTVTHIEAAYTYVISMLEWMEFENIWFLSVIKTLQLEECITCESIIASRQ